MKEMLNIIAALLVSAIYVIITKDHNSFFTLYFGSVIILKLGDLEDKLK